MEDFQIEIMASSLGDSNSNFMVKRRSKASSKLVVLLLLAHLINISVGFVVSSHSIPAQESFFVDFHDSFQQLKIVNSNLNERYQIQVPLVLFSIIRAVIGNLWPKLR